MKKLTKKDLRREILYLENDLACCKAELGEALRQRDRLRAIGKRLQDERNKFAQELSVREHPNRGSLDFALQDVESSHD